MSLRSRAASPMRSRPVLRRRLPDSWGSRSNSVRRGEIGCPMKRRTGRKSTSPLGCPGKSTRNRRSLVVWAPGTGRAIAWRTGPPLARYSTMTAWPGRTGDTAIVIGAGRPGETTCGGPGISAAPQRITEPSRAFRMNPAGSSGPAGALMSRNPRREIVAGSIKDTVASCNPRLLRQPCLDVRVGDGAYSRKEENASSRLADVCSRTRKIDIIIPQFLLAARTIRGPLEVVVRASGPLDIRVMAALAGGSALGTELSRHRCNATAVQARSGAATVKANVRSGSAACARGGRLRDRPHWRWPARRLPSRFPPAPSRRRC